jgi:hypothetical protein
MRPATFGASSTFALAMLIAGGTSAEEIPNSVAKSDLASYAVKSPKPAEPALIEPAGSFFSSFDGTYSQDHPIPIAFDAYNADTFVDHAKSIKWLIAGTYAATLAFGFYDWDWGNSSFHFTSEGYFGADSANGGMDKLGHAWGTMVLADLFSRAIQGNNESDLNAQITGGVLAMGLMTTVEVFDGFSPKYGFSYQDIIFDALGAGFSMVRNTVPGLREKLDYRLEYIPSGHDRDFAPQSDYSGQKYLLAMKLAGFGAFEDGPLRFVELQAGYFARGFTLEEERNGDPKRRVPYVAVGLNLSELLLSNDEVRRSRIGQIARTTLEHIQVPYTYLATEQD